MLQRKNGSLHHESILETCVSKYHQNVKVSYASDRLSFTFFFELEITYRWPSGSQGVMPKLSYTKVGRTKMFNNDGQIQCFKEKKESLHHLRQCIWPLGPENYLTIKLMHLQGSVLSSIMGEYSRR